MPEDQESGAAGDASGRQTAPQIAQAVAAIMLGGTSNEAIINDRRIVIKCARKLTRSVGVTYRMLDRIDSVVAAFERDDGSFEFSMSGHFSAAHDRNAKSWCVGGFR